MNPTTNKGVAKIFETPWLEVRQDRVPQINRLQERYSVLKW